jgi:hypothetical protein
MPGLYGTDVRDALTEVMRGHGGWAMIDELVDGMDRAEAWPDDFARQAVTLAKKEIIRRLLKEERRDGHPEFASIEEVGSDGERVRRYKQELLFGVDDYRQVVRYTADRSAYFAALREQYRTNCVERFGVDPAAGMENASP